MLKSTIIIPTYHRPKELTDCLRSILNQTVLPDEVIVVDDSELPLPPLQNELESFHINYIFTRKKIPGLTESRNKGIALSSGDIIFFLDDDVVLAPDFLKAQLAVYEADPEKHILGVCGLITNEQHRGLKNRLRTLSEALFMVSGIREGRVLRSGFSADFGRCWMPSEQEFEVDFLPGGATSYRRSIFKRFMFTDQYNDIGLGEDKDFSYQVAQEGRLIFTKNSCCEHFSAPSMRANKRREGYMFIVGRYLFFKRFFSEKPLNWFFFWYAVSGYVLLRVFGVLTFPNQSKLARLKGVLEGIIAFIKGDVQVPY